MADPTQALSETRRVLRPGGRVTCAVFTGPEANPWGAFRWACSWSAAHGTTAGGPAGVGEEVRNRANVFAGVAGIELPGTSLSAS